MRIELRGTEVVLAAVKQSWYALEYVAEYAAEELRGDRRLCWRR